jgi:hypothetical protein
MALAMRKGWQTQKGTKSMKLYHTLLATWMGISSATSALAGQGDWQAVGAKPQVLVPESAGFGAQDNGVRSHTHLRVLIVPNATTASSSPYNTPASIRSLYGLPATGGSGAIAIVDAYHYPTAMADFNYFSNYFGLPNETSTVSTNSTNRTFHRLSTCVGRQLHRQLEHGRGARHRVGSRHGAERQDLPG